MDPLHAPIQLGLVVELDGPSVVEALDHISPVSLEVLSIQLFERDPVHRTDLLVVMRLWIEQGNSVLLDLSVTLSGVLVLSQVLLSDDPLPGVLPYAAPSLRLSEALGREFFKVLVQKDLEPWIRVPVLPYF